MSAVQASLSGEQRILPELSATGMESGKLGEFGLSGRNDSAAVCDDSILAVLLSGFYFPLNCLRFSRPFRLLFL